MERVLARVTRIRRIYRLSGGPDAPARAREIATRESGDGESQEAQENASLLLSEITAERVDADGVQSTDALLTIEVRHTPEFSGWAVVDRGQPALPDGLRATALDEIADEWGVSRRSGLTRTWFRLMRRDRA